MANINLSLMNRYPRYVIFTVIALICIFLLLSVQFLPTPPPPPSHINGRPDSEDEQVWLHDKVKLNEKIYQRTISKRKELIKKFGPLEKIVMFPPDVQPWPPYTVWDFFPAAFNCPHEIERIGVLGDGGKWVCGLSRLVHKPSCVVYSVGINHESSFEADILQRTTSCQIWGYDFTVESFGPEIPYRMNSRAHFKPYKLGGYNADSSTPGHESETYKTHTLAKLMQINHHKHIDILKVDIEGAEFDTLTTLIKPYLDAGKPLPFGQLQLELHLWDRNDKFAEFLEFWQTLEKAGLRPFWTEPNLVYQNYARTRGGELAEYSFLNVHGRNEFIGDNPLA